MASAVIGALRVNLSADTAQFKRNLTDAERIAERFGRTIGSSIRRQLVSFGSAAAAVAGPAALGMLVKSSVETISAQVDLAKRVGASVGAIQTLQHAAEMAGASQEALAKTLGTLNARFGEAAREGAGPAYEALQRLGLSARELSQMDADERIKSLSDRMSELGLTTQQQADTLRDLGVRQQEIINLFQEGSGAIERAQQELRDWGVLLSDVDAAKVEEAGDAWDKMGTILTGVGNQIAVQLAPAIISITEWLGEMAKNGDLVGSVFNQLRSWLTDVREEIVRDVAAFDVLMRRLQLAQEVISSFGIGKAGGPDWKAFADAHSRAASDITKIWAAADAAVQQMRGPEVLLQGLDDYLNRINPLVKSVDTLINKFKATGESEGETDADKKKREKIAEEARQYEEQLAQKLATLQESLMTERETELAAYEQRLMDLEDFHNRGKLSDEEYKNGLIRNKQLLSDKLKQLDDDVARNNERNAKRQRQAYFQIADDIMSALGSVFGESKALAIAQAVINTAQAVTRSLAEYGATPLGLAAAAAAAAAGAAEIATIRSTTKSGGGGGGRSSFSSGSVAATQASAPVGASTNQQAVNVTLVGESFGRKQVEQFVEGFKDYQRDGGTLTLNLVT